MGTECIEGKKQKLRLCASARVFRFSTNLAIAGWQSVSGDEFWTILISKEIQKWKH
jgi:hypothetical protein